ncbi:DUF1521 domain-containing protein [Vibrio profundum]|uniref:DUF1521 domain-containing protein n=1 Tax=Vibrio profundum TaxID=2910247 RepID=UPI003D0C5D51
MQNVSNNSNQVVKTYVSSGDDVSTLDMNSMSIDNVLQYVILTLMDTRDNAAKSIQGLMTSVSANNNTAADIQVQASVVQGFKGGASGGDIVKSPTWIVNRAENTITLDNGYSITFDKGAHTNESQWQIHTPQGKVVTIWGDPHIEKENQDNIAEETEFFKNSTFVLGDDTKISANLEQIGTTGHYLTSGLTITSGNQCIKVQGVNHGHSTNPTNQTLKMSNVTLDGIDQDANTVDGDIYKVGAEGSVTKFVANQSYVPKSEVQPIIDKVKNLNVKLNGEDPQEWLDSKGQYLKKSDIIELNGYLNQAASNANQVGQNQQTMLSQNVQNLGNIQKNISAILSKLIDTLKDIIGIIR